jgi:hypothetical protein
MSEDKKSAIANSPYKQIETAPKIEAFRKGNISIPVATLSDGYSKCHIINDDHCYLLMLADKEGIYHRGYCITHAIMDGRGDGPHERHGSTTTLQRRLARSRYTRRTKMAELC